MSEGSRARIRRFALLAVALGAVAGCGSDPVEPDEPRYLGVSSTALFFSAIVDGPDPEPEEVDVTSLTIENDQIVTGEELTGLEIDFRYGPDTPPGWLTASLAGTSTPTTLTVRATVGSLEPGLYLGYVEIHADDAEESPRDVSVLLTVASRPELLIGPEELDFSARAGGEDPDSQIVSVANAGGGDLTGLEASISYESNDVPEWLTTEFNRRETPALLTVRASVDGLDPGTYRATIEVSSPDAENEPQTATVTFEVEEAASSLSSPPTGAGWTNP